MMTFAVGVEIPNVVPIERPHDADAREHGRAAKLRDQEQRFHCGLPRRGVVFGLGQLGDELGRIPERNELATARQRDWIVESPLSTRSRHQANSSAPAGVNLT